MMPRLFVEVFLSPVTGDWHAALVTISGRVRWYGPAHRTEAAARSQAEAELAARRARGVAA